jgi:hypothetical protein
MLGDPLSIVKEITLFTTIPQPRGCEDRWSSVLMDLGVDEMAGEIRRTF